MLISCPHCGFSKEVDEPRLPDRPAKATCPRCRQAFTFQKEGGFVPAAEAEEREGTAPPSEEEESTQAAPPSSLAPPAAASPGMPIDVWPKAGFWIRVVASLVDLALVAATQIFCGILLGLAAGLAGGFHPDGQQAIALVSWLSGVVLGAAYRIFFLGYCGQTPGKMAVRVKVVRTDGEDIGYGRAALREILGKFLSKIIFGIGYLMVAFDRQKQGLHDKIADTYVIKL